MSQKSKAQVAIEFITMISVSFLVGIIFLSTINYFYTEKRDEQNIEVAKEVLISVENELLVASKVREGYIRSFELPLTLNNVDYDIQISGPDVILTYDNIDFIGIAPNATGQLQKGANTVKNIGGKVCVNLVAC
ncbi:hypothetical protein GOV08_04520 [Candidatus Woesearchaeota archaeon]|nr:hypothetical protein [Candidatus Woesearchaeota archaeon]